MAQSLKEAPWAVSGYLTEEEAAGYIRTPVETLRKWRRVGIGPVAVKQPNGRVYYPQHLLDAWKQQLIDEPIPEPEERRPRPAPRRRPRHAPPAQLAPPLPALPPRPP